MNCLYNVLIPRDTSHVMLPYNCLCYLLLLLSFSKNSSEQFRNHVGNTTARTIRKSCRKYYTIRTIPKSCRKIPHCQNSSEIMQEILYCQNSSAIMYEILHCQNNSKITSKNTTLSEQFRNHVEEYHTVRTVQISCRIYYTVRTVKKSCRNNTLSEQFRKQVEIYHTVRTVQKSYRKILHCQHSSEIMQKNTTLSEQF